MTFWVCFGRSNWDSGFWSNYYCTEMVSKNNIVCRYERLKQCVCKHVRNLNRPAATKIFIKV